MGRYRLLASQHQQADTSQKPTKVKDPVTGEITERYPTRTYQTGDVVESDIDLEAKFGSEKFRRLGDKKKKSGNFASPSENDPSNPAVCPHGQVTTGFQETKGGLEGGTTVTGAADKETIEKTLKEHEKSAKKAEEKSKKKSTPSTQELEYEEDEDDDGEGSTPDDEEEEEEEEEVQDKFEGMNVSELKAHAQKNKINLKGATTKQEILKVLREGSK